MTSDRLSSLLSMDMAEAERLKAQEVFDHEVSQEERNARGQFATPPALAEAMVRFARDLFPDLLPVRFFDPGLGTGVFFSALIKVYGQERIQSASGCEIDRRLAAICERLWAPFGLKVLLTDFTREGPPTTESSKPNLIMCNPPYVRHHHLSPSGKLRLKRRVAHLGFRTNGLMGLYGYFLLLADAWLTRQGGAVWITPGEFLDVNYGKALKQYLRDKVSLLRIHRFDPADVQFGDALVTSVILAFRKVPPPPGHEIHLTAGVDLLQPSFERRVACEQLDPSSKWSPYFLPGPTQHPTSRGHKLGDFFTIKRGLATGDNSFFVLDAAEAERLSLPRQFLRPIIPGPRLVPTDVIESDPEGFPLGLPRLVLLDCPLPRTVIKQKFPSLNRYLQRGERRQVPQHYLPRSRNPWYSQEHRPPAPILCTYMGRKKIGGRAFRFIRNNSQATAYNVYLLLYPKAELEAAAGTDPAILDKIFHYLRSVPNLERVGRVYGGGLNKLEPNELANLEFPAELASKVQDLLRRAPAPMQLDLIPFRAITKLY